VGFVIIPENGIFQGRPLSRQSGARALLKRILQPEG